MFVITQRSRHVAEIKRSRFAAVAVPVGSTEEALEQVAAIRDPDATHNCWAYRIGDQVRFSDDGEPAGTAGRPILSAILAQEVDAVLVVVTRRFGGIKLGAGGLARAYGGTAAECLRTAQRQQWCPCGEYEIGAPFALAGEVHRLADRLACRKTAERWSHDAVFLRVEIEEAQVAAFEQALQDATRGQATLVRLEPEQRRATR